MLSIKKAYTKIQCIRSFYC